MHRRITAALTLAVAVAAAACGDKNLTNAVSPNVPIDTTILGSTPGWFNGDVVTFDYTAPFQCTNPPSAGSVSHCELGEEPDSTANPPAKTAIPVLYVMVPLGFTPPDSTLHCPVAGNC